MIKLSHLQPFAKGSSRYVYVHPDNPNRCLKIVISGVIKIKKQNAKFYRRWLPASSYDPNINEWKGYRAAANMHDEMVWNHIPRCYGFVETDLGKALSVQMIRNADDLSIGISLADRIKQGVDDSLKQSFEEFKGFASRTGFYTLYLDNIISARLENGKERLYLAECRYRRPGLTFIPFVFRKRTQKKLARLQTKIDKRISSANQQAKKTS